MLVNFRAIVVTQSHRVYNKIAHQLARFAKELEHDLVVGMDKKV